MNNILSEVLSMLSKGSMDIAFEIIQKSLLTKESIDKKSELIFHNARYNQIESEYRKGTITKEEYEIQRNKILSGLTSLISQMEQSKTNVDDSKKERIRIFIDKKVLPYTLIFLISLSTFIFLHFFRDQLAQFYYDPNSLSDIPELIITIYYTSIWVSGLSFALIVYRILYSYLDRQERKDIDTKIENERVKFEKQVYQKDLFEEVNLLNEEDKTEILSHIKESLTGTVLQTIKEEGSKDFKNDFRFEVMTNQFQKVEDRVKDEISSLNRKSNINLSIGVLTSVIGVFFLIYVTIFNNPMGEVNWQQFLIYFIPRLSLVIFIEIFSFYFLRLYRINLNEIKYYQDEMTDIDFKITSLKMMLLSDHNEELFSKTLNQLMTSEHNRIISNGETSLDLEKYKEESTLLNSITDKLSKIVEQNQNNPAPNNVQNGNAS